MNKSTLHKIDDLIQSNTMCCLTCESFKVTGEYIGMCKNAKSHLYLIPVSFLNVISPIIYPNNPIATRSGKCLFYESYIDGSTNTSMPVECNYCHKEKPFKDFYDKFAYFCSKECRMNFNDEFNQRWMEEMGKSHNYYHKLVTV